MITQQLLKKILYYDPNTGDWIWLQKLSKKTIVGSKAGTIRKDGYRAIQIQGKRLKSSHWAFLYMKGFLPKRVDHIDCNPLNEMWTNLREATNSQNQYNQKRKQTNKSGYKGVHWLKNRQKWRTKIKQNGKEIFLGYFDNKEEAALIYQQATQKYHKEFARW